MNKKEEIKSKRKIAAVDIMIFILVILCIGGIVIRIALGDSSLFSGTKGDYIVSYVVKGEDDEYSPYFTEGSEFFLESGESLGTLIADAELPPAEIYEENADGELKLYYAADGTVDFKGTLLVKGIMTDSGFLLNSNTYIAPNMTITVASSDITVELLITDITKAQ